MNVARSDYARKLMARGRKAMRDGMPGPNDEEAWVGAGLLMREALSGDGNSNGASDAAEIALAIVESTLARRAKTVPVACKRGCSYCCSAVVAVTAPEVLRIARWLRRNAASVPRLAPGAVLARCDERAGLSLSDLMQQRPNCPLLIDGACGVYTVRPINCRQLLSSSMEACRADFEGIATNVPFVAEAQQKGAHIRALLLGAMDAAGRDASSYELAQALSIALKLPDAEQRWLGGEDVFAPVAIKKGLDNLKEAAGHWSSRIQAAAK
jgi:hypothetical protein